MEMFGHRWFTYIAICIALAHIVSGSFLDYFLPQESEHLTGTEVDLPKVPYEIAANDEKFLQEASKLIGMTLSELDLCHHRVILKLRNSCHELNAEQIGKLAVMLLNCQSHSEGRVLFECTDGMSLKDCTTGMDPDTWNAYHLITNRAKAVCVATRHEQFRGLAEITVNKLMSSAHNQIAMMKELSDNQNKLQEITSQAIDDMTVKNENLLNQQQEILQVSTAHRATVESNLHELMREKGLIRSGQMEVAKMIDHLKGKIDESLVNLKQQSNQMKQNQAALLDDLDNLQSNAFHISDKLSETTEYILSQNEIASTQFDRTIQRLSEISDTIEKLSGLVHTLEGNVDEKLSWITDKIGGTDQLLENIYLILQHFGYLLMGMLLLVFINASTFYRAFFITSVPLNFFSTLFEWKHVSLIELSKILGIVFVTNFIREILWPLDLRNTFALNRRKSRKGREHKPSDQTKEKRNSSSHESETERETSHERENNEKKDNNNDYSFNYLTVFKNRYRDNESTTNRERSITPSAASNASFDSRSLTPFSTKLQDRIRCSAYTVKGDRCRNAAVSNQIYCRRHEK